MSWQMLPTSPAANIRDCHGRNAEPFCENSMAVVPAGVKHPDQTHGLLGQLCPPVALTGRRVPGPSDPVLFQGIGHVGGVVTEPEMSVAGVQGAVDLVGSEFSVLTDATRVIAYMQRPHPIREGVATSQTPSEVRGKHLSVFNTQHAVFIDGRATSGPTVAVLRSRCGEGSVLVNLIPEPGYRISGDPTPRLNVLTAVAAQPAPLIDDAAGGVEQRAALGAGNMLSRLAPFIATRTAAIHPRGCRARRKWRLTLTAKSCGTLRLHREDPQVIRGASPGLYRAGAGRSCGLSIPVLLRVGARDA